MKLQAVDITFFREDIRILSGINFKLEGGHLLWIKGDNGSGKTTLLRILASLITNFSGQVLFNGQDIAQNYSVYLPSITYIGHNFACFEDRTVLSNLKFWAKIRKTEELLTPTLHFFGLDPVADVLFKRLSSGWKKKVCLANLMLFNSKIWLLDEPFVSLDEKSKTFFRALFQSRLERGGIIVITSHEEIGIDALQLTNCQLKTLNL